MNLKRYLDKSPRGELSRLARCAGVSPRYISEVRSGKHLPSYEVAQILERETGGAVKFQYVARVVG